MAPRLELRDISKVFPGVKALERVSLDVMPGEVHALLGENGAGKSTLGKIIAGVYARDEGSVTLDGVPLGDIDEVEAGRLGVGIVHQEGSLVRTLSIADNIFAGRQPTRSLGRVDVEAMVARSRALLEQLGVDIDPKAKVATLSSAQAQVVEIAKALSQDLRLLILDEPTAALTLTESERLFEAVRRLKANGVSIVYVSHRLAEIFTVCDRVSVLKDGRLSGTREVAATSTDELIRLMVGRDIVFSRQPGDRASGPPILEVERLSAEPFAGLCAGDLYIYLGKNPYVTFPRVGGHEIAGVISAVGPGVKGVAIGERVVVEPFIGCGHCYPCRIGKRNCCANLSIIGVHRDGGFAERVIAPAANLHPIPSDMSDFEASFAEPVAIGVQACRRGEVTAGDRVLVLGAGPIGLAIGEVARARGAEVFITDLKPERLGIAGELGAAPLPAGDLAVETLRLTNGEGMPVVIEATGASSVMEQTVDLVAAGGRIVIVGLVKAGTPVSLPGLDITRKEVTLHGSRASVDCFPEALQLIASGAIRYPRIATRVALAEAPEVFARLAESADAYHKAVFVTETL